MIKENELRFGNWFLTKDGEYFQVTDLPTIFYYLEDLHPIPLTRDVLERAGFPYDVQYEFYEHYPIAIELEEKHTSQVFISFGGETKLDNPALVSHLHQLQNLYFALTGEEITVSFEKTVS
jgi:hypothetical protein